MKKTFQPTTDFCDEMILKEHLDDAIHSTISEAKGCQITHTKVLKSENVLHKNMGDYITITFDNIHDLKQRENIIYCVSEKVKEMLPKEKQKILVVGLGNRGVVSDALGPKTCEQVLVTAHLYAAKKGELLHGTREVAVLNPGVMGQTGLESASIVQAVTKSFRPDAIIAVDALATSSLKRINRAIQINNTGIQPGGGVGNHRLMLNEETLHVPVIAIGVATVTSIATIIRETLSNLQKESLFDDLYDAVDLEMIVTPKNMDDVLQYLVMIISESINYAVHPQYENL